LTALTSAPPHALCPRLLAHRRCVSSNTHTRQEMFILQNSHSSMYIHICVWKEDAGYVRAYICFKHVNACVCVCLYVCVCVHVHVRVREHVYIIGDKNRDRDRYRDTDTDRER